MLLKEEHHQRTDVFPKNKKKILIVDDEETILYMLKKIFIGKGFQVLLAKDGFGAMERLKAEKPDIVITELELPSLSGMDLIKFIHQNMEGIPIIVMTAYPHLYPGKKSGNEAKAFFVKPFDIDEMLLSVQRILGG